MERRYKVPKSLLDKVTSDKSSPDRIELDDILAKAASVDEQLSPHEINSLINGMGAAEFPEIRDRVLEVASDIRKSVFNGHVVVMAPIEVGNHCSSDCDFCGWRASNHEMQRSRVPSELILAQAKYLIGKGIYSIELVGGDDLQMVKNEFPKLIPQIRALFPEGVKGRIQICTAALTSRQYEMMKEAGADGIIVWQESYDPDVYRKHIRKGPKARGVTDDWKIDKNGDGYTFRLESQDRAFEAGLEIALGTMIGLNPDLNYELLATIMHARHLIARGVNEQKPLIVGMPTWNNITTPNTDKRPPEYVDPTDIFPYIAAIYFLSIEKKKAWIFPNCRVPIETQVEALKAGGVFTSTEVKLGPAGYIPLVLAEAKATGDTSAIMDVSRLISEHLGMSFTSLEEMQEFLDRREQFCHHSASHKEYKRHFHNAGLHVAPESSIQPDNTLERMDSLRMRRLSRFISAGFIDFMTDKFKVEG